jgi:hypothetical protein
LIRLILFCQFLVSFDFLVPVLRIRSHLVLAAVLGAGSVCAYSAELAILRNGNSIRHERRQIVGTVTRLYLSNTSTGYIEIPTDQIERFEVDTAPPPSPVQTAPLTNASRRMLPPPISSDPQKSSAALAKPIDPVTLGMVVNGAGEKHQIDPDFINSVIRAESGFNNRAVSKKGAQGLMQLMPQTASQLGVQNSFDPKANVEGGTKYLRELLEKYDYDVPKALAAYNAGPKRVDQYRGIPPFYETQAYVARIIRDFNKKKLAENPALANKAGAHKKASTTASHSTKPATARPAVPTQKQKAALTTSQTPGQERASR